MKKGKFIVLYGINNLGKTTQAELLVERLRENRFKAEYLKYPIYDLYPSGAFLNGYLRQNNPFNFSPREAQIIYAFNRTHFENRLKEKLNAGINIIAEDYIGTGLAWGMGAGVDEQFLKYLNCHLLKEDLAFLFDGERFVQAKEKGHRHENNDDLINKVRLAHLRLGQGLDWLKINANLPIEEIHRYIWQKTIALININIGFQAEKNILPVEKINPKAKLPQKAYAEDAGFDLFSSDFYSIYPGERALIKTGLKIALPKNRVGLIWDKSGLAKDGLHTLAGVIDSGFRGEVAVNLINLGQDPCHISPGQKIAQLLVQKIESLEIIEQKIDNQTERGEKGFGSTGKF